jgi:hypothetical protein
VIVERHSGEFVLLLQGIREPLTRLTSLGAPRNPD